MAGKTKRSFAVPTEVLEICKALARADEKAFVVGGVIRDILAGREPGDFDIATTAEPSKVMGLFKRVVPTGMKHGTVTVLKGDGQFEVTTLRGEGAYSDSRHPDSVVFLSDIEEDLARRDFTVNAMAWDPNTDDFHDPFDGQADVAGRLIRAVGDPSARFAEDGLRVLRAARFAATLGFEVEEQTLAAIPAAAPGLAAVSAERKRDELAKMLVAPKPSVGLSVLDRSGALPFVSAELAALVSMKPLPGRGLGPWRHAMSRVDAVSAVLRLRLAALLLDAAADGGEPGDPGEEKSSARAWLQKMRFERKVVESVPRIILMADFKLDKRMGEAEVRRFVQKAGREDVFEVLSLKRADLAGFTDAGDAPAALDDLERRARLVVRSGAPLYARDLAVNGQDIMEALSIAPGPEVGRLLDTLVDFVVDNPENNTRQRLLSRAKELM